MSRLLQEKLLAGVERMTKSAEKKVSFGISGAPGVGKTSVAVEVAKRTSQKYQVLLSKDVARSLARQGVRINMESETDDYLAFLAVRVRDMLELCADLVIYERTLLDVLAFMKLNGNGNRWLKELTEQLVRWEMSRLSLYFYIPVEFKAVPDGVRIVDTVVNHQIDQITCSLLRKYRPDFITLTGSISERVDTVLESLSKIGLDL